MRKKLLILLTATIIAVFCGLIAACDGCNENNNPPDEPETYIELDRSELTLDVLAREQLTARIKDGEGNFIEGEIVWSSSASAVATVQNGLVTALTAGETQITAQSGEMSAVCTVTVEANGLRPQLQLNATSIDMLTGETSKIIPSVRFKSDLLDDAEYSITYSFTASEGGVVSVASDGTVTALKYGTATVTVIANWAQATSAGLDGSLTSKVTVSVLPTYSLTLGFEEGYGNDIYLEGATDGENVYNDHTVLKVEKAIYNGEQITEGLVFKSSDVQVVTVDADGRVTLAETASEGDTAEVWVEYETQNEGVLTSEAIQLTVRKAIVNKTLGEEQLVDVSAEFALPAQEWFGAGAEILSVYDAEDTARTNIYDKAENAYTNVSLLGQRSWVVVGETICYKIQVLAVSKVITTAEDFKIFDNAAASSQETFPGYYVLGANIDASSLAFERKGYPSYGDGIGLTGTFDGRGYTVDGLTLGSGGLFGVVASTASVVNVAFTNVSINAGANGLGLMFGWYYVGRMENVYIGIKEFATDGTGSSASLGLFAACNQNTVFRNVVVVNSAQAEYGNTVAASQQFGALAANTNRGAWENTFVVSSMRMFGGAGTYGDTATSQAKSLQRFESMDAMLQSEYYTSHKVAFGDIWDTDTMTFASSAEYFENEINGLPETLEISVGNTLTVTRNSNAYKIQLSQGAEEAGIVLENGKITATRFAPEGFTVTVSFGSVQKVIPLIINNSIVLENFTYTYNLADGEDFVITDEIFAGAQQASVKVTGTDGNVIEMQAQVSDSTLVVDKAQFTGRIPSGAVSMSAVLDGVTVGINGVKLIYAVNTEEQFLSMAEHLTAVSENRYDGSIVIASDLDFEDTAFDGVLTKAVFVGELDGGYHTLKNISVTVGASGAFFGTLYGTVKNVVVKNASISNYCGVICYENYGTVENCYVKGSIPSDVVTASPDNFGAGLIAAKNRNGSHVKNCIAELVSRNETLYVSGAFGKLGDGSANEERIFENCYAVSSANFAIMTYGANRTTKDFDENNGNKNFATIFDLFNDETASALAEKLGVTAPVVVRLEISNASISVYAEATSSLTAKAYTADGEEVAVDLEWNSSNGDIATVENGLVTGLSAGTAVITVSFGELTADCTVTVIKPALEDLVLENFSYAYNGSENFVVTGEFPEAENITAKIKGLDGEYITLTGITLSENTLTIPAEQFNVANMPTKEVEMSLYFDEDEMIVRGVYLTYTVTTVEEYMAITSHLTVTAANTYDGSILIGTDLDFTGKSFANANVYPLFRMAFNGELDGGNHVLSNITMNGSASGAFCGTLNGTVKNLVIRNAVLTTYGGIICDLNYGTIQNCYVQGSINSDGVSVASDNFGAGLLAARNRNNSSVKNCIVELVSKGTTYVSGAFGRLGDGSANEARIFENCYAVSADNFALFTYGANRTTKNFDENNGNKNFATIFDLFDDETASALAQSLGLSAPEVSMAVMSEAEITITVNASQTLTAIAYTADEVAVKAPFVWNSSDSETVCVENGVVTGLKAGSATITATFNGITAQCTVTVSETTLDDLDLTDFTYAYNGTEDFAVTGEFPEAEEIKATVKGMDGSSIELTDITVSEGTLTIPAEQFVNANMPTKEVEMTLYFDGIPMTVNGVYLIYTINTLQELQNMKSRLTADYDGHLLLGTDIDFSGVTVNTSWGMRAVAFKGIFDGGLHTISNLTVPTNASQFGLLGNMQAGSVAKNIIMTNVVINTYCGSIAYLNNGGTIQNCYVKGSIVKDGLSSGSAPGNFGCGLLVGRSYTATAKIENCIVEVVSHGEINSEIFGAAAFGMMGASVNESKYTNCYAVNAEDFALCTNAKPSVFKNFENANNGNFATLAELFQNETASQLAVSLGLTAPAEE